MTSHAEALASAKRISVKLLGDAPRWMRASAEEIAEQAIMEYIAQTELKKVIMPFCNEFHQWAPTHDGHLVFISDDLFSTPVQASFLFGDLRNIARLHDEIPG